MYKVFELSKDGKLKLVEMPDYEETVGGFNTPEQAEEAIDLDTGQFLKHGNEYVILRTKYKS